MKYFVFSEIAQLLIRSLRGLQIPDVHYWCHKQMFARVLVYVTTSANKCDRYFLAVSDYILTSSIWARPSVRPSFEKAVVT